MCKHHPETAVLIAYAGGKLNYLQVLLLELHLEVCSKCQQLVTELESIGGQSLQHLADTPMTASAFDSLIAAIESQPVQQNDSLKETLKNILLQSDYQGLEWQWRTRRFAEIPLTSANDEAFEAKLIYFKKGMKVPKHTHPKQEITLVLKGAFSDSEGSYGRGDYIRRTAAHEHAPVAESDCICLAITDAPLKFTGTFGPVLNWLLK